MQQQPGSPPPPLGDDHASTESIRWTAVLLGVAVDWVATLMATMMVFAIAATIAESRGADQEGAEAYIEQLLSSPDFMMAFMLVGLLCVSFGGYVAARRAGYAEVRHATLVGIGSILLTLGMESLAPPDAESRGWGPTWFLVLGYLLVIPFGALGGVFAERTRTSDDGPPH